MTPKDPVDRHEDAAGIARASEVRTAPPRRVGTETSKTRIQLLDCVEQLMLDEGYAAVTYRAVAAKADVTAGTVQYYFPTLDDLFIATVRRRSESGLQRLVEALRDRPDQPLRTLWEYTKDETTSALVLEFTALANHRRSIRAEITDRTMRLRAVQLEALTARWSEGGLGDGGLSDGVLSPGAWLFLMTGVPMMIQLEEGFGITTGHSDVVALFESYLDSVEPLPGGKNKKRKRPTRR